MLKAIELTFQYTEKEYTQAIKKYFIYAKKIFIHFILAFIILAIGLVIANPFLKVFLIGSSMFFILLVLSSVYIIPNLVYHRNPKLKYTYSISFTNEAIVFKSDDGETELEWNIYHKAWTSKDFYYLFYGKTDFTIIPRRVFTNEQEEKFKHLIDQKIKKPIIKI